MRARDLTIAIVARNEAHQILDLLEQIRGFAPVAETLVYDNDSSDGTAETVEAWLGRHEGFHCRLFRGARNHMARARNHLLEEARTSWVYFLDADCRLEPVKWRALLAFLELGVPENVAAFGGGNVTPTGPSFVSHGLAGLSDNWWGHMGSIQIKPPARVQPVMLLSTCNLIVRRNAALACGGFDAAYSFAGEDLSLCHRLHEAGHGLLSVPGIEVLHLQDRGLWQWCRKLFLYGRAQVHVATRYPRHFSGWRGLQCAALIVGLGAIFLLPVALPVLFAMYLLLLGFGFPRGSRGKVTTMPFIVLSHASYAAGELWAIVTLPVFHLFSLPTKIPILEKQ